MWNNGKVGCDPMHFVYNQSCIDLLKAWEGAFQADFIFADPPFNIDQKYDVHDDRQTEEQFNWFTTAWWLSCINALREGGVIAINVPDDMVKSILLNGDVHPFIKRIDWCIWHYRFGQCGKTKFISSKTHCLIFRKGAVQHTWNPDDILVDSLRATKYNDPRTLGSATPGRRVPFDVWDDIPRVVGNAAERVPNHPNQLPERYLERLILAYTNPNDFILDPFGGTGTTSAMAARHGRRSVTCDISESYCLDIIQRVKKECSIRENRLIS